MEREVSTKSLDWPTIVEFFTKRGRPMTQAEYEEYILNDRQAEHEF